MRIGCPPESGQCQGYQLTNFCSGTVQAACWYAWRRGTEYLLLSAIDGRVFQEARRCSNIAVSDEQPWGWCAPVYMPAERSDLRISPDGAGNVRVGMTPQQVASVLGGPLTHPGPTNNSNCSSRGATTDDTLGFLFLNGRLDSIRVREPSRLRTAEGVGIGSDARDVQRAYASGLERVASETGGYNLIYRSRGNRYMLFQIDDDYGPPANRNKVTSIRVGGRSIRYYEGCI